MTIFHITSSTLIVQLITDYDKVNLATPYPVMNFFKFISSFIYPLTVERTSSALNPLLEVRIENGKYVLNSEHANYSFGSLHHIFKRAFKMTRIGDKDIKNVLLLGFGAGSVPALLADDFKINCHITAVEIDEKVLTLARKYFNIHRFDTLHLICADAFQFVQSCNSTFDLIVVDIFVDDKVPVQFETPEFLLALKKLMRNNGFLFFNKIPDAENGMKRFDNLVTHFKNIFGEITVLNVSENRVIAVWDQKGSRYRKNEYFFNLFVHH
jgi:spermidine synthase